MILHSDLSRNDDHHPDTSIVNTRRRRAKCGLIPAVWDLDAILLRLPPQPLFYASREEPQGDERA